MKILKSRRSKVITAASCGVALGLGAIASAYFTGGGSGAGTANVASTVADIQVTQSAPVGTLLPGNSVPLAGTLTNPNNTDVKVGSLSVAVTSVSNGANAADFTVTGGPVIVNTVVKKGTPVPWSGLTLNYANSDVNQDNAKGATVNLTYALTAFQENVVPPLGTYRVLVVNGVRTFDIYVHTVTTSGAVILPGDTLSTYDFSATFGTPAWADNLATADASGNIRYYAPIPTPGHDYQITVKRGGSIMASFTAHLS